MTPETDEDDDHEIDPLSDPEERQVLYAALDAFRQYRTAAHYNVGHARRQNFHALPAKHSALLSEPPINMLDTFQRVSHAIDRNADVAEAILATGLKTYGIDPANEDWKGTATSNDLDKARSTIRQLYREFSTSGAQERVDTFDPFFIALARFVNIGKMERHNTKVLVPGAGLGRLMVELCASGYSVEGNEISYHQLLASNWVLNHQTQAEQHSIFPWALNFSNHFSRADQFRECRVPDILVSKFLEEESATRNSPVHPFERLSMSAGDFCVEYKKPANEAAFSAVATCFFIDTAPNFLAYVETVLHCLEPFGIWMNMGPLLWHFESGSKPEQDPAAHSRKDLGIAEPGSIELTNDEVVHVLKKYGFRVWQLDREPVPVGYIGDDQSMLRTQYRPSFWVASRPSPEQLRDLGHPEQ